MCTEVHLKLSASTNLILESMYLRSSVTKYLVQLPQKSQRDLYKKNYIHNKHGAVVIKIFQRVQFHFLRRVM